MLKNFIKGIKEALPAVGGIIGYSVAGPLGAGIGSGIGSLAAGKEADDAFRDALVGGAIGYGGQTFFGRDPSRNTLGLGSFFREGKIPGVSNIITPFSQRGTESTLAKMASLTAPKAKVGATTMSVDDFIAQRVAEVGSTDPEVLEYAKDEAIKDFYGQKDKFDVSDFFVNNAGYIIPAAIVAGATGGFDEKTETLDLPMIEAGSQGALPTGLATLINPMMNPDGTYTYNVNQGGIMTAKEGKQAKKFVVGPDDLEEFLNDSSRFIQTSPNAPKIYDRDQKFKILEKLGVVGRAKDGGIMNAAEGTQAKSPVVPRFNETYEEFQQRKQEAEGGLTDRQKELLKMLEEQRMQEILEMMQNEKFKMDQFQNPKIIPTGPGKGVLTIGAAEGMMMDGSISNFQMNSPRRDLFLEREGPISDDRGSPDKDTVYAKLADGEFVVNADTVADIGYGMGAKSLDQAKEMGGSFFYGLQDAQKKGILGNMVGRA
tara:strand:- start:9394 stop:10851 length:1458 start_codon:yes stop_codon:yes gene_type:complete